MSFSRRTLEASHGRWMRCGKARLGVYGGVGGNAVYLLWNCDLHLHPHSLA
ncbi:uncharacterized protein DS421_7g207780 [Arachis hypogaea]|nr:uncharacterized protein DS421_7g207780 [Arachis hypogaea]